MVGTISGTTRHTFLSHILNSTFFYAILLVFFSIANAKEDSFIGIKKFSFDQNASEYYKSIDILLFQRLSFELLPRGIRPALIEHDDSTSSYSAVTTGSIQIINNDPILFFTISGKSTEEEETKKIPLSNQSVDAIIDILAIKVRHFLEQTLSGKLRILSTPKNCDILLNGIKIGNTPAELVLEQGNYNVELYRQFLIPHSEKITILPGKETLVSPILQFKGNSLKPWLWGSILLTGCTIISRIIETELHEEYRNTRSPVDFNQKFDYYKTANAITILLLIPTVTTWTFTGYHYFENRTLKKTIFSSL